MVKAKKDTRSTRLLLQRRFDLYLTAARQPACLLPGGGLAVCAGWVLGEDLPAILEGKPFQLIGYPEQGEQKQRRERLHLAAEGPDPRVLQQA